MSYFIKTDDIISLSIDGESYDIRDDFINFKKIDNELNKSNINWIKIKELLNVKNSLINYIGKNLKIEDNLFTYKFHGKRIELKESNPLIQRIISENSKITKNKFLIDKYLLFLDNLTCNRNKTSINELFLFLEHNDIFITYDGYFLAYKIVRNDYYDKFSQTYHNIIGNTISMNRDSVCFDRKNACSAGLHFCSKEYASSYKEDKDKIMIIKINPKDVVSIPYDYNNSKGRCCRYEVINEIPNLNFDIKSLYDCKDLVSYFSFPYKKDAKKFCYDNNIKKGSIIVNNKRLKIYNSYKNFVKLI